MVRDYLLQDYRQANGKKLSVESISRELSIMSEIVNLADRELDLNTKITNPFSGLELPKATRRKSEQRLPLPDDLVDLMTTKLKGTDIPQVACRLRSGLPDFAC